MQFKKITIFAGHYGSGKTNLAVNLSFYHKKQGRDCSICDLDIVNPYFRSKDSETALEAAGIRFISSPFANSNVDLPSIPAEAYSVFAHSPAYSVIDLGGDDRGAYALGRFAEFLSDPAEYDMLMVLNQYRPDTRTPEQVLEIRREIEDACHVRFTGLVNNSNLGRETTRATVEETGAFAQHVSELTGLPLVMTSYSHKLEPPRLPHPFAIDVMEKDVWQL